MECPLCGHQKAYKYGKTSKGSQRYHCPNCQETFTETFDTLYYRRQITQDEVHTMLQSYAEGSSLRGIARVGKRAYGTVVSLVQAANQKAQLIQMVGQATNEFYLLKFFMLSGRKTPNVLNERMGLWEHPTFALSINA
jgi:transposase-like protein